MTDPKQCLGCWLHARAEQTELGHVLMLAFIVGTFNFGEDAAAFCDQHAMTFTMALGALAAREGLAQVTAAMPEAPIFVVTASKEAANYVREHIPDGESFLAEVASLAKEQLASLSSPSESATPRRQHHTSGRIRR